MKILKLTVTFVFLMSALWFVDNGANAQRRAAVGDKSKAIGNPVCELAGASPIEVQTSGNAAVGYATLGAAFAAINAGTHTGMIAIHVCGNTTESGSAVLNSSGAGAASYSDIVMYPLVDSATISGASAQGRGLIELNGADNVVIDGDNPSSAGTNRNLSIINTASNTTTFTSVIRIALNTTTVNSADNNLIRNLNLVGSSTGRNIDTATSTTASENTTFGIIAGPNASDASTEPAAITSVTGNVGAGATAANLVIENNNIVTAARAISMNASANTVFPDLLIDGNSIGNSVAGEEDQVTAVGITVAGSTNAVIRENTVNVEGYVASSAAGHGISVGVLSTATTGALIERNMVNRARNNNPASWSAYGINLGGGSSHAVVNNFVSGVINSQTAGTGAFGTTWGAYGIRIASGTGHSIYHNSVHLYGAMTGSVSSNLTAAFVMTSATLQTGVDVRNNIFSNQISGGNPEGTRNTVIYLPPGGTSSLNLTINNNALYAGTDALNTLAQVGPSFATSVNYQVGDFDSTSTSPASNFRAYTSGLSAAGTNDNASFAFPGAPPFVSNTDLHIPDGTSTPMESRGTPVGVLIDIDEEARDATTPDIGADEFDGLFVDDFLPPSINYSALSNTTELGDRSITVTITDETGIPTDGALIPRIYSSKNGGAYVSAPCTFESGTATNSTWTCTISSAALGGVMAGDSIEYFVIAQDTATPVNVGSNPGGVEATDVNTVTEAPPSPNSYLIVGALPTSVNVGDGGMFTSLTNPGGLFEALNVGFTLTGDTVINITSDLTAETGAINLEEFTEEAPGGYTLTIKPSGGPRIISGTAATSRGIINLDGTDRLIIDGSLDGGDDRSLTIRNLQTGTSTVVWIKSLPGNGANNNVIKNTIIHGATVGTATTTAGILTGSSATIGNDAEAANNDNRIENNWIFGVQNSMYVRGGLGGNIDQNWVIVDNDMGSAATGENNTFRGMLIGNANNFWVTNNRVQGVISTATTTAAMSGIQVALAATNGVIASNDIRNIRNVSASGTGAAGIAMSSTTTNANTWIVNNMISDVAAVGSATVLSNGHGITATGGSGWNFYYNSVNLATNQTSGTTAAMHVTSGVTAAGALNIRNNIFANTQTSGATRYSFHSAAPSSVYSAINYNNYWSTGSVGFLGSAQATLALWQAATGQDANSLAVDPLFVSPTDLHIEPGSPVRGQATPIAEVTEDFDGDARDPVNPDMGADEVVGGAVNLDLGGRVLTAGGRGIGGVTLRISGGNLSEDRLAFTSPFGFYNFEGLDAGTYTVTVFSKRHTFTVPAQVIVLGASQSNVNFTTVP